MAEDDKKPEGETPKKKTGPAPSQVNPKDVENQKRINKGAEENLALSERINNMLNRRISLQQDEVKLQRDISNCRFSGQHRLKQPAPLHLPTQGRSLLELSLASTTP